MTRDSCSVCGAHVKREKITYTQTIGDKVSMVMGDYSVS